VGPLQAVAVGPLQAVAPSTGPCGARRSTRYRKLEESVTLGYVSLEPDAEHPRANINRRAQDQIRPIMELLDERLELTEDTQELIWQALANAVLEGVRIGAAEALAQAAEQGLNLELQLDVRPKPLDELGL
jgi:hypothetical protein